jgi:hypothetical protein
MNKIMPSASGSFLIERSLCLSCVPLLARKLLSFCKRVMHVSELSFELLSPIQSEAIMLDCGHARQLISLAHAKTCDVIHDTTDLYLIIIRNPCIYVRGVHDAPKHISDEIKETLLIWSSYDESVQLSS